MPQPTSPMTVPPLLVSPIRSRDAKALAHHLTPIAIEGITPNDIDVCLAILLLYAAGHDVPEVRKIINKHAPGTYSDVAFYHALTLWRTSDDIKHAYSMRVSRMKDAARAWGEATGIKVMTTEAP